MIPSFPEFSHCFRLSHFDWREWKKAKEIEIERVKLSRVEWRDEEQGNRIRTHQSDPSNHTVCTNGRSQSNARRAVGRSVCWGRLFFASRFKGELDSIRFDLLPNWCRTREIESSQLKGRRTPSVTRGRRQTTTR